MARSFILSQSCGRQPFKVHLISSFFCASDFLWSRKIVSVTLESHLRALSISSFVVQDEDVSNALGNLAGRSNRLCRSIEGFSRQA